MKLPDTNVLVHAVNRDSASHGSAVRWLGDAFDSASGVGLAWVALLGFVRISTRRGILARPLQVEQALAAVNQWIDHPHAHVLHPGARHASLLGRLFVGRCRCRRQSHYRCAFGRTGDGTPCGTRFV